MSMQSIMYRMLKLIIDWIDVVIIFISWPILLDIMSLNKCYFNKLMIVNIYMCSSHQMFAHIFPKHKLMLNLKLDILSDMLIYRNDIFLILL